MRAFIVFFCVLAAGPGTAATGDSVRIGVLTASLGVAGDLSGEGSVLAAQMAVEDFGSMVLGKPVEIVAAGHQNRPSVGGTIAQRWFEHRGADVIVDVPNASVAEVVRQIARDQRGLMIQGYAGILTRPECQSNIVTWAFDGEIVTRSIVAALKERGRHSWHLLSPDTRHSAETATSIHDIMKEAGANLVGSHRFPLSSTGDKQDTTALLADKLMAPNGTAVFLNAGPAATKSVALRLHRELGGRRLSQIYSQSYPALRDNKNLNEIADEIIYALPYRRDNAAMLAFSERFSARADGRTPSILQIGIYSAVTHYLRAVRALGTQHPGEAVGAKMQELPVSDPIFGKGKILPDGRRLGDIYVTAFRAADGQDHVLSRRSYDDNMARISPCARLAKPIPSVTAPD